MVEDLSVDSQCDKIKKWLSPPDPSTNLNEAQKKRYGKTGIWFLESELFKEWKLGARRYIWLHGIPGCGKTVLSARIIEYLHQQLDTSQIMLDFFFDFSDSNKQSVDHLLRTFVVQLYSSCRESRTHLDMLHAQCGDGTRQPTTLCLRNAFLHMVSHVKKVQIVIDALDECKTREELFSWMEELTLSAHANCSLLLTSRAEEEIRSKLKPWLDEKDCLPILSDVVNADIRAYVRNTLYTNDDFQTWNAQPNILDKIETRIMEKADGMSVIPSLA